MKKLTILSTILILATLSLSVQASNALCRENRGIVGGTIFYKSFLYVASGLKQPYTYFYQTVDDVLENNIETACPKLSELPTSEEVAKMETFLKEQHTLCNNTCDAYSSEFHKLIRTKFFAGSKIKTLQKECKHVCQFSNDTELAALKEL